MTLKKWFFLFWSTMAIGAVVCMVGGLIMLLTDQGVGKIGLVDTGFNLFNMFLGGIMIGAFSQMGFFAYLTLNYIALSVFRKKYLWNALQGYTTFFGAILLGYVLYQDRTNNWFFWVLPIVLMIMALVAAYFKVKQTKRAAFIPTLFLMFVVTAVEAYPALQGDTNVNTVIFMLLPLFACNFYQNYLMTKLTKKETAEPVVVPSGSAVS
ncbi:KinB-signaling pathway activation protein [Paenibacillus endoradicis]|uniref:KinB-signaling pathway activation protein n=1 Tax=Paenibacillus endoradicis TaxID=2972487 RepID=UPI0021592F20|nr:KinB-signaling pathway activation protein [Paenibacillus endoradicis]MCR8660677.1 KinB-signaling pathway activation protein [Paenibacillus endoradicis]